MSDEAVHYMESTSRLRAEVESLRAELEFAEGSRDSAWREVEPLRERLRFFEKVLDDVLFHGLGGSENQTPREKRLRLRAQDAEDGRWDAEKRAEAAEATMREVAEELRRVAPDFEPVLGKHADHLHALADRLDPPPVVENPSA